MGLVNVCNDLGLYKLLSTKTVYVVSYDFAWDAEGFEVCKKEVFDTEAEALARRDALAK